ncbi:MAG: class I SAM-dependent RNA methyltransferase [Opitutales bacterium]
MAAPLEQPDFEVAVCRAGLEPVVARELRALGLEVAFEGVRMVAFRGGLRGVYLASRALRAAVQVLKPLRKFRARDYERLYHQARKTPWHRLFSPEHTLRIDVKGTGSGLRDQRFATYRIKDAITDTFRKLSGGKRPSISRGEPDVRIVAYLYRDEVTLYLDATGAPLNARGYRTEAGNAPLKEDLAAGLLMLAGWEASTPFADPMAGAGTLAIEAALMAAGRAPNLRRTMAFQHWNDHDAELDGKVQAHLEAAEQPARISILACEQDAPTVDILERNLARADLTGAVQVHRGPFQNCRAQLACGTIVTNPPYGERLPVEPSRLFADLERWAASVCPDGRLAIFAMASAKLPDLIDFPPDGRVTGLYNGQLAAQLASFRIPDSAGTDG